MVGWGKKASYIRFAMSIGGWNCVITAPLVDKLFDLTRGNCLFDPQQPQASETPLGIAARGP
jgi:hypothetical protein